MNGIAFLNYTAFSQCNRKLLEESGLLKLFPEPHKFSHQAVLATPNETCLHQHLLKPYEEEEKKTTMTRMLLLLAQCFIECESMSKRLNTD
jgi:hypothetical protein